MFAKKAKGNQNPLQNLKRKRRIKLAFLALLLVFGLIVLGRMSSFLISFNRSLTPGLMDSFKGYQWDGKSTISLVFAPKDYNKDQTISVVSFYPKEERIVILHINDSVYMELPKGYGSWRVGSIYKLGQEENPPRGASLLKLSMSKLLGLPIDGILLLGDNSQNIEELIFDLRKKPFSVINFVRDINTDLSVLEVIRLSRALSSVRADKVRSLDFEQSVLTASKLLPDSTRVLGVDNIKLDLFVKEKMGDEAIIDEAETIAIFNATTHPGLAQEAARMITNLGGNVVMTTNTDLLQQDSLVVLSQEQYQNQSGKDNLTQKRLTQIFAPKCIKNECNINDNKVNSSRAQIGVILGEDYFKRWYQR